MPTVEGVFVFLAEEKHDKKPLKVLESFGKEILTGILDGLVEKNVLKLEETEKKKFQDAKTADKARVLVDSVCQKRHEAGQALVQTFLNMNKNSTSTEGKNGIICNEYLKFFKTNFASVSSIMLSILILLKYHFH